MPFCTSASVHDTTPPFLVFISHWMSRKFHGPSLWLCCWWMRRAPWFIRRRQNSESRFFFMGNLNYSSRSKIRFWTRRRFIFSLKAASLKSDTSPGFRWQVQKAHQVSCPNHHTLLSLMRPELRNLPPEKLISLTTCPEIYHWSLSKDRLGSGPIS